MSSYKLIFPIIMVLVMLGSVYMLWDTRAKVKAEYDEALSQAREYAEQDIEKYAVENYTKALDINPTVDVYYELGKYYFDIESYKKSLDVAETMMDEYADNVKGYELALDVYLSKNNFRDCFELNDVYEKRSKKSEKFEKGIEKIKYEFYIEASFQGVTSFCGDVCSVMKENNWGYRDKYGDSVTGFNFNFTGPMFDGYAPVIDKDGDAYIIDSDGSKVDNIKDVPRAVSIGMVVDGICPVYDGSSWSYYNTKDGLLFGGYDSAGAFSSEVAAVQKNGKWNLINYEGSNIIDDTFDEIFVDEKGIAYRNERLFVEQNGSWYMIDAEGKKITDEAFEDARLFADTTYAAVKKNGKWGYIDNSGKWFIEPKYDEARSFSNGFAAVKTGDKWGFINSDKELCIECQFDDAKEFSDNGSVFVKEGEEWQFLMLYSYNH